MDRTNHSNGDDAVVFSQVSQARQDTCAKSCKQGFGGSSPPAGSGGPRCANCSEAQRKSLLLLAVGHRVELMVSNGLGVVRRVLGCPVIRGLQGGEMDEHRCPRVRRAESHLHAARALKRALPGGGAQVEEAVRAPVDEVAQLDFPTRVIPALAAGSAYAWAADASCVPVTVVST